MHTSLTPLPPPPTRPAGRGAWVNDLHSGLNPTRVARVLEPDSQEAAQEAVAVAARSGEAVCVEWYREYRRLLGSY